MGFGLNVSTLGDPKSMTNRTINNYRYRLNRKWLCQSGHGEGNFPSQLKDRYVPMHKERAISDFVRNRDRSR